MKSKSILALSLALAAAMPASAQKVPAGGKAISSDLIGIFFEDISYSADGGLNAELVQNGSFEYSGVERDEWGPTTAWHQLRPGHSLGTFEVKSQSPIHPNNPNYLEITIERVGHYYDFDGWTGYGLKNDGFDGISVRAGEAYDFSMFARPVKGLIGARIVLVGNKDTGKKNPWGGPIFEQVVLGEDSIKFNGKGWDKYQCTLTANQDWKNASLQVLFLNKGVIDVDMFSLVPQNTFKGHGLRKDLAEALVNMNPKFMRFPGGCVVHGGGDGFWNTYHWKNTIGPKETRKGLKNTWGYHQSMGLGYFEYFQLCEDMGCAPVPILPCGVSCQGTNGGWNMKTQAQDVCPMEDMEQWTQDALDLIEWANGDVTTTWGKKRAEAGHPAPFGLKYLGIGNEEKITPEFCERFKYMYERIMKAYPDIIIVGTAGPGSHPGNPDLENGWKLAEELGMPIIDEHYYEPRNYFQTSKQYDAYPRDRKTKVYLGEYAAKDKKLIDAVSEALYLIHVERNADIVCMTSYAPLFAKKGHMSWNPDLIYFDNDTTILTCSYFVQQMFGQHSGDYYYDPNLNLENKLADASIVLNSKKKELYIKMANASDQAQTFEFDLSKYGVKGNATVTVLTGDDPMAENNFDAQPIQPQTSTIKATKQLSFEAKPCSFNVIKIKL